MDRVLFLDDDRDRHQRFRTRTDSLGYSGRYRMIYVFTAAEAIRALRDHEGEIVRAYLDHDLSEDDILVLPGEPTKVPTGMMVVDHIVTMQRPPPAVVVHSLNHDAAVEMCSRLASRAAIAVTRIPFPLLLGQLA